MSGWSGREIEVKIGTKVGVRVYTMAGEKLEPAVIARPLKRNLPMPDGYHLIKYSDGAKICAHETRLVVL